MSARQLRGLAVALGLLAAALGVVALVLELPATVSALAACAGVGALVLNHRASQAQQRNATKGC